MRVHVSILTRQGHIHPPPSNMKTKKKSITNPQTERERERENGRERDVKTATANKEHVLLQLKRSSLAPISFVDLSYFGSVDPWIRRPVDPSTPWSSCPWIHWHLDLAILGSIHVIYFRRCGSIDLWIHRTLDLLSWPRRYDGMSIVIMFNIMMMKRSFNISTS